MGLGVSLQFSVGLSSPFEVSASLNRFRGDSADLDRSWWVLGGLGESLGVSLVLGKSWWVLADLGGYLRVTLGLIRSLQVVVGLRGSNQVPASQGQSYLSRSWQVLVGPNRFQQVLESTCGFWQVSVCLGRS